MKTLRAKWNQVICYEFDYSRNKKIHYRMCEFIPTERSDFGMTYYLLFTPGAAVAVKTYKLLLTTYYLLLTISVCNFTLFRIVTYYLLLTFYWLCVSVCNTVFCGTHQVLVGRCLPLCLVDWLIVSLGRSPPNMLMGLLGSSHTIHMSRGYMCMVWVVISVVEDAALNQCRRKSGDTSQPVNL